MGQENLRKLEIITAIETREKKTAYSMGKLLLKNVETTERDIASGEHHKSDTNNYRKLQFRLKTNNCAYSEIFRHPITILSGT